MQDNLPEKTDSLRPNGAFPISVGQRPGKQMTETSSTVAYTQLELWRAPVSLHYFLKMKAESRVQSDFGIASLAQVKPTLSSMTCPGGTQNTGWYLWCLSVD